MPTLTGPGPAPLAPGGPLYSGFSLDDFAIDPRAVVDSLVVVTQHNGIDDPIPSWAVVTAGRRYAVTGTVPATYAPGDTVCLWARVTIGAAVTYQRFDRFQVRDQRLADLATFWDLVVRAARAVVGSSASGG